ncbi:MAG: DNA-binding transcription factor yap1 [Claussenomyces sp. TS43310]|nr:MAG: DNA-binding transcription factor yap1 [Claussenomyces sp. TS43310]
MASTSSSTQRPNFILSPHQQNLLFAALNSNKASNTDAVTQKPPSNSGVMSLTESPVQQAPDSGTLNGFEESPFVDYDYDFDPDGSFDYDFSNMSQDQMIGNLPGSSSDGDAESHDKRGHPDDDDNDDEGGGKRREGDDKGSKKPGRKPLTSEPTSKRKAQNRAAQRAFRERKERHLKDLETKVHDLEKASESANQENSILRAKLEKMAVEVREYKKRLSLTTTGQSPSLSGALPPYLAGKGSTNNTTANPSDVNFQFEFPRFGRLPGAPPLSVSSFAVPKTTSPPASLHRLSTTSQNSGTSPTSQTLQHHPIPTPHISASRETNKDGLGVPAHSAPANNDMAEFSGLFSPSLLESVNKDFSFEQFGNLKSTTSTSSSDSASAQNSTGQNTSYNSPSDSSTSASNNGVSSSCGTSPEPSTQSPSTSKQSEKTLGTIGEEHGTGAITGETSFCEKLGMACGNPNNPVPRIMSVSGATPATFQDPAFNTNSIDWFAQQNGNQFDPQLFGDYREPQSNILAGNGLYDDSFFSDAFAMPEFNSPLATNASPAPPKKDLVAEIDDKLNAEEEVVPGEAVGQMLTCNNMWSVIPLRKLARRNQSISLTERREKLQACPSVQSGEIDMDSLCSQLQQKAKCSGDGPVIDEKDFKSVIGSILPGKHRD